MPNETILIIDDKEVSLLSAKSTFQGSYNIKSFSSLKSAKCFLNSCEPSELPDLILMDVFLQGEYGLTMIDFLKKNEKFANIPFIFQSGGYDPDLQASCFEAGASDFILKPYNRIVARKRVERAIKMSKLQHNLEGEIRAQTELMLAIANELIRQSSELVDVLISTIGTNDKSTQGHSSRVCVFAEALAKKVGYPEEKLSAIRRAGLLHDIGKIGVSNHILNKEGKLTTDEYSVIMLHPEMGEKILSKMDNFEIEANCAAQHQERWDGKGYPCGLQGEAISYEARIVTIADVYDVMRFGRIYQAPKTNEIIAKEFEDKAGTQFDPELALVFADMIRSGEMDECINKKQKYFA